MNYFAVRLQHAMSEIDTDLCVDALAGIGFESFETEEGLLTAYIPEPEYRKNRAETDALLQEYGPIRTREDQLILDQDWNAVWESRYEPVRFDDFCFVHAPFHRPLPEVRYNIEIEPKMSFGTAHHPTTALMIRFLREEPPVGKSVLDMGCGTGVLGILSAMQGARSVVGIDIDEWAYRNAIENVRRNGFSIEEDGKAVPSVPGKPDFSIRQGDASLLQSLRFDTVIANINRNILLRDMGAYSEVLSAGGVLYLSGFYSEDMEMLERECNTHRLFYQRHFVSDRWAAMKFLKK